MFKKLIALFILLFGITLSSKAASLTFDLPSDTNNIARYNLYVKTNSSPNTNYFKFLTLTHPNNVAPITFPNGESYSFYATSEDINFIESDPSNTLDYFVPIGPPPENTILNSSIDSFNAQTRVWNNVNLNWVVIDKAKYGITNYTVNVVSATSTNKYTTTNNSFTISTLALNDYTIYVTSINSLGTSPLSSKSIWTLSSKNPKKVQFLRVQ